MLVPWPLSIPLASLCFPETPAPAVFMNTAWLTCILFVELSPQLQFLSVELGKSLAGDSKFRLVYVNRVHKGLDFILVTTDTKVLSLNQDLCSWMYCWLVVSPNVHLNGQIIKQRHKQTKCNLTLLRSLRVNCKPKVPIPIKKLKKIL